MITIDISRGLREACFTQFPDRLRGCSGTLSFKSNRYVASRGSAQAAHSLYGAYLVAGTSLTRRNDNINGLDTHNIEEYIHATCYFAIIHKEKFRLEA